MKELGADDVKVIRGVPLRRDPAREPCFTVVELHKDLHDYDDMSAVSRRQRLHRHMHNEMQTMEIAAQGLADFPDAPWELRLQIARQCWDEARHTQILYERLLVLGGRKGEFPIMNYEWGVTQLLDSLPARLAVQNRTFEAEGIDAIEFGIGAAQARGDQELADLFEGQCADEIMHVRIANEFIVESVRKEPRNALRVAAALSEAQRMFGDVFGVAGTSGIGYLPNEQGRLEAGFAQAEVDTAVRLARERRASPPGA